MTDAERCQELLRRNQVRLVTELDAMELMHHLPCLRTQSKEGIDAEHRGYGRTRGMIKLLDELKRRDNWHQQFVDALCHPDINKPELANLISPSPRVKRRVKSNEVTESAVKYDLKTPVRRLPAKVPEALRKLDYGDGWMKFASELDIYNMEDTEKFECNPVNGSCTMALIKNWSHRPDATLQNLIVVLEKLQRFDILEELSQMSGFEKIPFPKGCLDLREDIVPHELCEPTLPFTITAQTGISRKAGNSIKLSNFVRTTPENDGISAVKSQSPSGESGYQSMSISGEERFIEPVQPESAQYGDVKKGKSCFSVLSHDNLNQPLKDDHLAEQSHDWSPPPQVNTEFDEMKSAVGNEEDNHTYKQKELPIQCTSFNPINTEKLDSGSKRNVDTIGGWNVDTPEGRNVDSPEGRNVDPPEGRNVDSPEGRNVDPPEGRNVDSPEGRNVDPPEGRNVDTPEGRNVDTPEGRNVDTSVGGNPDEGEDQSNYIEENPNRNEFPASPLIPLESKLRSFLKENWPIMTFGVGLCITSLVFNKK